MAIETNKRNRSTNRDGGYECKTCKKRYETFQALGGHQGTHKKVKLSDETNDACLLNLGIVVHKSSGLHRCQTCMKEFETGQALGGHMRRHRLEKALILMEKESMWQQQAVVEKAESDVIFAALELQLLKSKEDERDEAKTELVLAAQEWRLSV
ncbi:putative transcription factor C2H2 family [Helianthus annuus]|uniref:Transcription factor C2H2 family n=1 Tax=Helianthus annuus TaxID=4232 RepID=A0A9K3ISS8_HELAN|nr:zinc finger protein ZAT11-like [Helianthus annuus]KAF5801490.1 putative transcription factor C2H2 family [Helianthus annuus]KAJ0559792.1 putative transcription factor C2H2 family [Helianthus annuus]KAJ0565899.1 putative transcription factor C2H2 family [Helianthus annuus]KAJ0572770.1 putative transcription factor C2H2 family [Helianthus annuus]KAJ0737204.1 putative transcription factor C2H2 family [Helianthus annuus]